MICEAGIVLAFFAGFAFAYVLLLSIHWRKSSKEQMTLDEMNRTLLEQRGRIKMLEKDIAKLETEKAGVECDLRTARDQFDELEVRHDTMKDWAADLSGELRGLASVAVAVANGTAERRPPLDGI